MEYLQHFATFYFWDVVKQNKCDHINPNNAKQIYQPTHCNRPSKPFGAFRLWGLDPNVESNASELRRKSTLVRRAGRNSQKPGWMNHWITLAASMGDSPACSKPILQYQDGGLELEPKSCWCKWQRAANCWGCYDELVAVISFCWGGG